jgi:hypothetical protein
MYGDTAVMRRRVDQLREQGADLRALAENLVGRSDRVDWRGRAAEAMRERIQERAAQLRDCAARHETAADRLEGHLQDVDALKDAIAQIERRAHGMVADARTRVARIEGGHPADVTVTPTEEDRILTNFTPPPSGHRDWLAVELPGL